MHTLQTPYYLYDTELLQRTLDTLNSELRRYHNYHVHYAIKANSNPLLLKHIQQAGLGVDCVSGGEIEAAINAGFHPSTIVFAGVGKTDQEIRTALYHNIFCFNVESEPELEVINQLATQMQRQASVCLRINPEVGAHTHSHITTGRAEDKFGISMQNLLPVVRSIQSLDHITLKGLHFHIGSQLLAMDDFIELAHRVNELQELLAQNGTEIEVVNVGGGLGVDYDHPQQHPIPDFATYFATFNQHLHQRPHQQIHFELGRAIVAQCGSLISRVLYVKQGTERQFVILDAGMTDLIRPALYGAHHQIENISATNSLSLAPSLPFAAPSPLQPYDVVGPICESSDVFGHDVLLPPTSRGDLIAVRSAGAYGETMASQYNMRPLPKSYSLTELSNL